uniref:Reverse transcriptase domain-containing protein n=1 Tax=Haemonchus contortus TaxID=6289 RepID=A0A7I5E9C8_HAECO
MLCEFYDTSPTTISPFYKKVIIDVNRGVRQGNTIPPKLSSAALEKIMRHLDWDGLGVKVDNRYLHPIRFADDSACGKSMRLNLRKTMFMRNSSVADVPLTMSETNISMCFSYVYLGREVNMMIDVAPGLRRRKNAAWGALKNIEEHSEYPAPHLPIRQCYPSCFDVRLQDLDSTKAG